MKQIIRKSYLNDLEEYSKTRAIKVITGVRRCGKSTLLEQFKSLLKDKLKISKEQIIDYDFNDIKLRKITYENLYDKILKSALKNKVNYVFLDEIQEIDKFEECVISLFENKQFNFDIYLTGSNSKLFSSSLATKFTGRNIELKVYPFSFKEIVKFAKDNNVATTNFSLFERFLKFGSLPIILDVFNNDKVISARIKGVLEDSISKDVLGRHKIRNTSDFKRITKYLFDHIGQPLNIIKIANFINSNNRTKISARSIDRYINWIEESILMYRVSMYSTIGKRTLITAGKVYAVDTGLRNFYSGFRIINIGSLLENIVYIELLRRGYEVSVGKNKKNKEIDFIGVNGLNRIYIQVCENLNTQKIKQREADSLRDVNDNKEKIILVYTGQTTETEDGIKIINLIDWLLDENK